METSNPLPGKPNRSGRSSIRRYLELLSCISLAAMVLATADEPPVGPSESRLGEALMFNPEDLARITQPTLPQDPGSPWKTQSAVDGFSVNTQSRMEVLVFYQEIYRASEGFADRMDWTGEVSTCTAGDVSDAFRDDTRRRINYFRAMAGLPADIVFNTTKSAKAQEAALIMSANGDLSHYPGNELPPWSCLTPDGEEAAGKSNIAFGSMGTESVDRYMEDEGSNNRSVGHRRWLLYPPAKEMGSGSVPDDGSFRRANAIWVIGDFGVQPSIPEFVTWPPAGYVPSDLVYPRWSFSYPAADFGSTTISMAQGGQPVSLTVESSGSGAGDNTLVWRVDGFPAAAPEQDTAYTVQLQNVSIDGTSTDFSYEVILMDPEVLGEAATLSGPAEPVVNQDNVYGFTPVSSATRYQFRVSEPSTTAWVEGAEDPPPPHIIAGTSDTYTPITTALVYAGAKAFQLAFETFADNDQTIEVDRWLVPSVTSRLQFQNRFRFAGVTSGLHADISTDGGITWTSIYSRFGNGSTSSDGWESTWTAANVSLAEYAGRTVRVRVRYRFEPFTEVFLGTSDVHGVFVDEITITHAEELSNIAHTDIDAGADTVVFRPTREGDYLLQMRPEVAGRWWGYSVPLTVRAVATLPGQIEIDRIVPVPSGELQIDFTLTSGAPASFTLLHADIASGAYAPVTADLETLSEGAEYRFITSAPGGSEAYFRIRMQ